MRWAGERVVVVGAGRAGQSIARALSYLGARVFLTEKSFYNLSIPKILIEEGGHIHFLEEGDWALPSPGISPYRYPLQGLSIPKIGELDVVAPTWEGPSIGVTGTNGKTTTVSLLSHTLQIPMWGNVGPPLGESLFSRGIRVLELSSFQLHFTRFFRPFVAILLNVGEDHKDWYPRLDLYRKDKFRIFRDQTGREWKILPRSLQSDAQGYGVTENVLWLDDLPGIRQEKNRYILDAGGMRWQGDLPRFSPFRIFDVSVRATLMVAALFGLEQKTVETAIRSFSGLPHRMEVVGWYKDRLWINDSKATNPHAVRAALQEADRPVVLILGGLNKGLSFQSLRDIVAKKVRRVVVFGASREEIARDLEGSVPLDVVPALSDAVRVAWQGSQEGDWILFSPGCASFDAFRHYAHRGEVFREIVRFLF